MIRRMTEKANELGAKILLNTPVQKIIIEEGKAVGILANDMTGEEIEARAKAVIICTGGFGDNPHMIKCCEYYNVWNNRRIAKSN